LEYNLRTILENAAGDVEDAGCPSTGLTAVF